MCVIQGARGPWLAPSGTGREGDPGVDEAASGSDAASDALDDGGADGADLSAGLVSLGMRAKNWLSFMFLWPGVQMAMIILPISSKLWSTSAWRRTALTAAIRKANLICLFFINYNFYKSLPL